MSGDLEYQVILNIVKDFYALAINDILIGYHFRFIDDFEEHFPRIADFWQLQLTGKMDHPESKPFDIINKHIPLKVKPGEIDRWVVIFEKTLNKHVSLKHISSTQKEEWMQKIKKFQNKMHQITKLS